MVPSLMDQDMVDSERLVLAAARHVEMAQRQQQMYQAKKQAAIDTLLLPPLERVLCFVADYAQNMSLPNFASEQPGATYYYSPFNVYVFGVVEFPRIALLPTCIQRTSERRVATMLPASF